MQGEEWNMGEEDTFVNLKFLFLDEVTLAKWMFGEKSFPVLEKLVLSGCHKLEEIPSSFGDICSLKIIQLVNSPQLEDSAKKIKQYFEDMGGDELQITESKMPANTARENPVVIMKMEVELIKIQETNQVEENGSATNRVKTEEHMVTVIFPSTSGARNIHVTIEFLLIVLTDMPKDFIHHDKLFDLLARVGALIREVSTLVSDLEEKSRNEESTDKTSRATLDLLKTIELLKEDLKYVYLKAPDAFQWSFPMSDGPLFLHLQHRHLNDLLDSNAYSIALIKEEIELVKEALEFIRSFFLNFEQGLYKDLWARIFDVAYEAKAVIDSIIARDNGLLHLIFSLPITIKKIKHIKEEVSNISEKIPKNSSLTVANSTKKPVERKSLTTDKMIVGFKEETNWLITKLTCGPKDLDVISITGMPGSGKTTLAYKVYS
ncbi:putative lysine-specific demethylase JMJ14-like, partial [Capsicum annuum]